MFSRKWTAWPILFTYANSNSHKSISLPACLPSFFFFLFLSFCLLPPTHTPRQSLLFNSLNILKLKLILDCEQSLQKTFKFLHLNLNCSAKTNFMCNKDPKPSLHQAAPDLETARTYIILVLACALLEHKRHPKNTYVLMENLLVLKRG